MTREKAEGAVQPARSPARVRAPIIGDRRAGYDSGDALPDRHTSARFAWKGEQDRLTAIERTHHGAWTATKSVASQRSGRTQR